MGWLVCNRKLLYACLMDRRGRAERWLEAKTGVTKETGWNVYWSGANKERANEKNQLLKVQKSSNQREESMRRHVPIEKKQVWLSKSPSPPKKKGFMDEILPVNTKSPEFLDILESLHHKVRIDEDVDLSRAEKLSLEPEASTPKGHPEYKTNKWKKKAEFDTLLDGLENSMRPLEPAIPLVVSSADYREKLLRPKDTDEEFDELFSRLGREHSHMNRPKPRHSPEPLRLSSAPKIDDGDLWALDFS